ncbi:MAG: efflux RND transporter periplasmic adaptor subunit [Bradymonadales bacterium]|nr:efflux RND transporter periplasmic adaptor subunit [Bradymonadales bacterium]
MKGLDRETGDRPAGETGGAGGEVGAPGVERPGDVEFGPELWAAMVRKPHWAVRLLGWLLVLALAGVVAMLFLRQPEPAAPAAPGGMRGAGQRLATAVRAVPIERGTVIERGSYPGQIETYLVDVTPDLSGRLEAVQVRIGERVEAGQELARLDDTDLRLQLDEAEAQLEAADAARRRASTQREAGRRELERADALADDQIVSAQEVDTLQARLDALESELDAATAQRAQARARIALLRQQIDDCSVVAPFSGTVSDRYRDPGAFVQAGAPIVRLVADGPLRVLFSVPEAEIGLVSPGNTFVARVAATGDLEVTGRVVGIAGEVIAQGRIVRVEGELEGAPDTWFAGMYTEVQAVQRVWEQVQVVPAQAVLNRLVDGGIEASGIFRADAEHARWTPVSVMGREADRVAIESQAEVGEAVLVSGHEDLTDGAAILVVGAREGSR